MDNKHAEDQVSNLKLVALTSTIFATIGLCFACWTAPEDLARICKAVTWLFAAISFYALRQTNLTDRILGFLSLAALMAMPLLRDFTSNVLIFAAYTFTTTCLYGLRVALGFWSDQSGSDLPQLDSAVND